MIERSDLGDGVVRLDWNMPGPVNCMNRESGDLFAALVDAALADPAVSGIVVTSSKPDFIVGADLDEARAARTAADFIGLVAPVLACLRRLETGGKPVVAALAGAALGGGFEIALACHRRVATVAAKVGFPEVTLSLIPGAGGTQRLTRLIGIAAAAPLLLEGTQLDADKALGLGLIDEVVPAEGLVAAAKAWIAANPAPVQPWDRPDFRLPGFHPQSQEGRQFFALAWARLRGRTAGNDLAAETILEVLHHGAERSLEAGIKVETRYFGKVAAQPAFKNRLRTQFFGVRDARAMKRRPPEPPSRPAAIGVIGGGLMGGGIAYAAAAAGLAVTLIDVSQERAEASRDAVMRIAEREASRGRLREPAAELVARVAPGVDYGRLAGVDLAVEAVFERREVKREVLAAASAALRPGVPLASNTSSIPIGELAAFTARPAEFAGMHFFSPVERMPLVEVIRARATSDATIARCLDFLKAVRKTPVVVHDGLGFYTGRVFSAYTFEAFTLLAEGVAPQFIDNAALLAGMPIGPLALADATGLPLLVDIAASMKGDGDRVGMRGIRMAEALEKLVAGAGRKGKAAGGGIYDYPAEGKTVWPGLATLFPPAVEPPPLAEIQQRLIDAQSLEAVRALADGVLDAPIDGDVAAHLGWGYPAQQGGPFAHVDDVDPVRFARRCDELADRVGGRFEVPGLLRQMAGSGRRFYEA